MATMNSMETLVQRAVRCMYNVMFLSQPALGKTFKLEAMIAHFRAHNPDFFYMHIDGGTTSPTDLVMAMPNLEARVIDLLTSRNLPNFYDTPDLKGIIYVGEWMLMGLEVSKGMQKLVNHEDYGDRKRIPPGVIFIADGNRLQDRSGGAQQSRAVMSRFMTVELDYDIDYALDVIKGNYHQRVATFLIRNPQLIDTYSDVFENDKRGANDLTLLEGKQAGIWPNLRSWDRISRILYDVDATGIKPLSDEISRNIGSGNAATWQVFQDMIDNLATMEEILAKPDKAIVPTRMDERYALSTMLALTVQGESFKSVAVYMQRFDPEFQASFFRLMNDRLTRAKGPDATAIRNSMDYKNWITAPYISAMLVGASQS